MRLQGVQILPGVFRGFPQRLKLSGEGGVVLIATLWICALIMWFALQISAETRLQSEDQLHSIRKSQAFYLATGGCYEALARIGMPAALHAEDSAHSWQPDGRPHILDYQTGHVLVIIESEDSKVNVNRTGAVQLKQILSKAGADEVEAEKLADCIMDFIDQDDIPRTHGAEKDAYRNAGLGYVPFNGPMTSLDQLLLVPGITHRLFYGLGQSNGVSPDLAEIYREFLVPDSYSLFEMLTIYGNNVNLPSDFNESDAEVKPVNWKQGGIYRILSFGRTASGPPAAGIWLTVRFTSDGQSPYTILSRKAF